MVLLSIVSKQYYKFKVEDMLISLEVMEVCSIWFNFPMWSLTRLTFQVKHVNLAVFHKFLLDCRATINGGAIYSNLNSMLTILNVNINNSSAPSSGCLGFFNGVLNITSSSFSS